MTAFALAGAGPGLVLAIARHDGIQPQGFTADILDIEPLPDRRP